MGRGARENCRASIREVEEIRDEPLESTGLGGDDPRRVRLLRVGADRAVGHRLRVPADRGERCAEVVRHAQDERPLHPAGVLELRRHRVQGPGQVRELIVRMAAEIDARGQVAGRDRPGGLAHGLERPGEAAGEEHRNDDRDPDRHERGDEEEAAGLAGRVLVDLLREEEDRRAARARRERLRDEDDAVAPTGLPLAGEQGLRVEITDAQSVRELQERRVLRLCEHDVAEPDDPVGHLPLGGDGDHAAVGDPEGGDDEAAESPSVGAPRLAGPQPETQRLELGGDLGGLVLELLLRGVGRAAPGEAVRGDRGDRQHADRDPGHREDEPGPQRAALPGHAERAGLLLSIR